jgi:hypothetical protein
VLAAGGFVGGPHVQRLRHLILPRWVQEDLDTAPDGGWGAAGGVAVAGECLIASAPVRRVGGGSRSWVQGLPATHGGALAAHGGTAGILREQAPSPLNGWPGVDAIVISTDNSLT